MHEFEEEGLPAGSETFEIMFKWGGEWIGIMVVRVTDALNHQHYIVKLPNDIMVILQLNDWKEWEEFTDGPTELAKQLGHAIENYYMLCS